MLLMYDVVCDPNNIYILDNGTLNIADAFYAI